MRKLYVLLLTLFVGITSFSQTILINPATDGGFESGNTFAANGWTSVNHTTNTWQVGAAATAFAGTNSAFVSNNNGTSWAYTTSSSQTSHFYKDITVPAGETKIQLTFQWKGSGESNWDRLLIYTAPTSVTPVAGTPISNSTTLTGATLVFTQPSSSQASYTSASVTLPSSFAGTTFRLIFTWQNDGSGGTSPGASVDNISLTSALPGTFTSVATGNWNTPATWDANAVPSAADNAVIASGHTVTIDASSLQINDLSVSGTLVYASTPSSFTVSRNLTVNTGGTVQVYQSTTGKTLNVGGDLTNNGTIDLSIGTASTPLLTLNGTGAQTISGNGTFTGNNIRNLTFNNSSTAGITWGFNNINIGGTLTFTAGRVHLGANKLTLGTGTTSGTGTGAVGSLSYTSGGFTSGTFNRYWASASGGTVITGGSDPTGPASRYPFVTTSGANRAAYIERVTPSAAGQLSVTYTDASTTSPVSITDGAYTVETRYNGYWTISAEGTTPTAATYKVALIASGAYIPANGNSRVVLASSAVGGTHQNGTTTPGAQRTGLSLAQLTAGPLYIGIANADVPFLSVATGNWEDGTTWNKGVAPTSTDVVTIVNGHTVTVNNAAANASSLAINSGGALALSGNSLTIGATLSNSGTVNATGGVMNVTGASATGISNASGGTFNVNGGIVNIGASGGSNRRFSNSGTLSVSSGTLNINGNLTHSGTAFNQSGGSINIDGNAAGVSGNSVASGSHLLNLTATVNWTGGTLTIVDPHAANSTSSYALNYDVSTSSEATTSHTLQFGDGVSSEAGGNAVGFHVFNWVGSGRLNYGNLVINGPASGAASSVNRVVTLKDWTNAVRGNVTINSNGELNQNSIGLIVAGNIIVNANAILTASGTISLAMPSGTTSIVNSSLQSIGGAGTYRNALTTPTANLYGLTINNSNASGITLPFSLSVSSSLTLTQGILNTTATEILTLNNAATASGGSTGFVNGPMQRIFVASRSATGTYSSSTLMPVGKGTAYLPIHVDPSTTSGGTITMKAEAFTSNTGSMGGGVTTLSSNRWEALVVNGSANFNGSFLRIGDGLIAGTSKILQSDAPGGTYSGIPAASNYAAGTPNTLTTGAQIPAGSFNGYFAYGDLTACAAPTNQPTNFVASNLASTSFTGTFTAAASSPSHYLVVRYATGATPTNPTDFTGYAIGATIGTAPNQGTVVANVVSPSSTFNATGLTANTAYDFYVYSYNNSGCSGPVYYTSSPLIGNVTTCATVGTPGTPTSSLITSSGFRASWTASSTAGVTYEVDVATNSSFTNLVTGYSALNVGTNLFIDVTGLSASTTYYVRVRANNGGCFSSYSSSLVVTTACAALTAPTAVQTFATYVPSCWSEATGTLAANTTLSGSTSAWGSSTGFANTGTNPGARINLYSTKNDWLISPAIDLGTGGYRIKYNMAVTEYDGTAAQSTLGTHKVDIVVSTDGGATWSNTNVIKTYTGVGSYSNTGQEEIVALTGYTGVVRIAFVATTTSASPDIHFHIDNFVVEAPPSCDVPTGLTVNASGTTATINWTASTSNPANGYEWEVRSSGAGGSGAAGLVTSGTTGAGVLTANASGLNPATSYTLYVRSNCGNGDYSNWASSTFTTFLDCAGAPVITECTDVVANISSGNGVINFAGSYPNNSIGYSTPGKELIYRFTPTVTGVYYLEVMSSTGTSSDYIDYLYKPASAGCSATGWMAIDDNSTPGKDAIGLLQAGVEYYIILDSEETTAFGHTFKICRAGLATPSTTNACVTTISLPNNPPANSTKVEYVIDNAGNLIAGLDFSTVTNSVGTVTVTYYVNNGSVRRDGNNIEYLDRNFTITTSTAPATPVNVTLYFTNAELQALINEPNDGVADVGSINDLVVTKTQETCAQSAAATAPGSLINQAANGSIDATTHYITISVSSFSTFYLHGGASILPANLVSFSGQRSGNVNALKWTTATEQNNQGFFVERSVDGRSYTSIGFVASRAQGGNSNSQITYTFNDNSFSGDKQYYRLRQVDLDGKFKNSNIVLIRGAKPASFTIGGLFPNPATAKVNVLVDAPSKDNVVLQVVDVTGKVIKEQRAIVEVGSNTVEVDVNAMASGTYILKLISRTTSETSITKFIKQ